MTIATPAPIPEYAGPLGTVGVIGAGTMASQFAVLFALRLDRPVVITDVDRSRLDAGLANARAVLDRMVSRGRVEKDRADRALGLIRATLGGDGFAEADWVIEAVFEDLAVKQDVMAHYEKLVGPHTVLATNTSSLSVEQIGRKLSRPEQLVGFHFFNPVAVMRLIEVVRSPVTATGVVQLAVDTAGALGKTPVVVTDTAGFLVNRLLTRVLAQCWQLAEAGTPISVIEQGLDVLELPMTPFELLEMVGPVVGGHVLTSHRDALGDRFAFGSRAAAVGDLPVFWERDGERRRTGPTAAFAALFPETSSGGLSAEQAGRRVAAALADEIDRMIVEGVVGSEAEIDTAMALAAGYTARGITVLLRELGAYPPVRH